jgi:CRP-like cAMP-binding protein
MADMEQLRAFFSRFAPLSDQDWEAAAVLFSHRKLKKGELLVREGEICNELAVVASGLLRLYYLVDGQERNMLFFPERSMAADYFSFLTRTPSIRIVEALEPCALFTLSHAHLQELYRIPAWNQIGRVVNEHAYVWSVLRANRLLHDDHETRFRTFIKEEAYLLQRVPQYMIASYLDMTPETFSRLKRRFRDQPKADKSPLHSYRPDNPFFPHPGSGDS